MRQTRDRLITVRLSRDEEQAIRRYARSNRTTVSAVIRTWSLSRIRELQKERTS
jgi:hypothetical protein